MKLGFVFGGFTSPSPIPDVSARAPSGDGDHVPGAA